MDISGFQMPDVIAIGTVWNFYFKDKSTSDKVIPGLSRNDLAFSWLAPKLRKV